MQIATQHTSEAARAEGVFWRFYDLHVMPRLLHAACSYGKIDKQRALVVPAAEGDVVELGIGSGLNLRHYDPARVRTVIGIEPNPLWSRLGEAHRRASSVPVTQIEGDAHALPLDRKSADTVVVTYTLCSLSDTATALAEARRVLKPGGRLLFVEHGAAPDAAVARWQERLTPLTRRLAGGCHLNRNTEEILWVAGFGFDRLEYHWVSKMPRTSSFHYLGAARPR